LSGAGQKDQCGLPESPSRNWLKCVERRRLSAGRLPIHQKYADNAQYHANERSHRQSLIEKSPRH
jgi:hypothetical protein